MSVDGETTNRMDRMGRIRRSILSILFILSTGQTLSAFLRAPRRPQRWKRISVNRQDTKVAKIRRWIAGRARPAETTPSRSISSQWNARAVVSTGGIVCRAGLSPAAAIVPRSLKTGTNPTGRVPLPADNHLASLRVICWGFVSENPNNSNKEACDGTVCWNRSSFKQQRGGDPG